MLSVPLSLAGAPLALTDAETRDVIMALVVFCAAVFLSFFSRIILRLVGSRIAAKTKTTLDDLIIEALTLPLAMVIILAGVAIALQQIELLQSHGGAIARAIRIGYIVIGTVTLARAINVVLDWYSGEIAVKTKSEVDDKLIPVLKRVVYVVVYSLGAIIILDQLGVQISPLIAGLGIGGLAVALALQPTLTNYLAGTYVIGDGVIKKGHYIMMDNGTEGFVEEIGWRTTKLRHWQGNLIVLPNSKLAEAIVRDYEVPSPPMVFTVSCGVSYASDLKRVEAVTIEVARRVLEDCPEGAKDFTPVVRFKEFGDSNINFAIVMKGTTRTAQFILKHELIKALNERFNQEGIEIQYPARKLYFADGHAAPKSKEEDMAGLMGSMQPPQLPKTGT